MNERDIFFYQFESWVLLDIKLLLKLRGKNRQVLNPDRSVRPYHRPFIAAVILMCCAIDCLAAFRYGRDKQGVGTDFKNFIRSYFPPAYDQDLVYDGLRNALIHGYSMWKVGLSHTDKKRHLTKEGGRFIIDVFSLFEDLVGAYEHYRVELINGKHITEFFRRNTNHPIARWIEETKTKE